MARHWTINERTPRTEGAGFLAPDAVLAGDVRLGARSSVWFGAVLRAERDAIVVGEDCNLQDHVVVHTDPGHPAVLGDRVTVGHRAVLHGCTVEDDVLVGIGAVVLNGARIGAGALVAAGALVPEGAQIPAGALVVGVPGRVLDRPVPPVPRDNVVDYLQMSAWYRAAEDA